MEIIVETQYLIKHSIIILKNHKCMKYQPVKEEKLSVVSYKLTHEILMTNYSVPNYSNSVCNFNFSGIPKSMF